MITYIHIDQIGLGTCAAVRRNKSGRAVDICGCMADGVEPIEDTDGWIVCANCGHDIREVMADELVDVSA